MHRASRAVVARSLIAVGVGAIACGETPTQPVADGAPVRTPVTAVADTPPPSIASLRETVRALSDDEMEGRKPGTPGGARAVAYIIEQMKAIGLRPAGESGGWTQPVPMRGVLVDPSTVELSLVGGNGLPRAVEYGREIMPTTYDPAGKHAIDGALVFVGYGVTAPEEHWDDYGSIDLRGKIAVVLVGDPPTGDARFAGPALTYYGRWSYKFERALAAGAAGCLVVHDPIGASYGWNVVENSWSGEQFVLADKNAGNELDVQAWISGALADQLAVRAGTTMVDLRARALAGKPPLELGVNLRGSLVTSEVRTTDVNVIGELGGARWPDQVVTITAHWDHLGRRDGAAAGADAIFNGAVDNASGIAAMLGVASQLRRRASAGRPLGRSVLFVATTGEEEGLLGSEWLARHPVVPLASWSAVVNLDSVNVHGRSRTVQVIGPGQTDIEDTLREVVEGEGRSVVPDERPETGGYYRSDHFSFARRGVPAIYVRGGSEMEIGGVSEGKRLRAIGAEHYHTVDDEFDATWSFAGTLQDVGTVASLVGRLADAETPARWKPGSEFAATRR